MKSIIIIGAGIGGCTTYLFLKKYLPPDVTVHIYESHPPPPYLSDFHKLSTTASALSADAANVTSAVGGFLGLSPNGIRVIESLDRSIYERIKAVAIEVKVFGAQVSSGRMLGNFKAGGKRHGHGTLLVARAAVHDAVLKEIKSEDISFKMKAENVIDGARSVKIEFENGETEEAELVIGADGVWGRTREAIPECGGFKPEYDGMVGIGAFMNEKTTRNMLANIKSKKDLVIPKDLMTMTFGSGAFFGTVIDRKRLEQPPSTDKAKVPDEFGIPFAGWWSTFPMDPAPTSRTPFSEVKDKVLAKHKDWTPLIPAMIESSGFEENGKNTFVLPRWITPSLPKWTSDSSRIVLMGDAAHCMPPDSGQGVSCAVEDAMTLGLLCEALLFAPSTHNASKVGSTLNQPKLKQVCDLYVKIRKPRCDYIVAEAKKRGNMKRELTWWDEAVRNLVIRGMCKIMPDSANDAFFSWDVETEVSKALKGEVPAVKGKGKVRSDGAV